MTAPRPTARVVPVDDRGRVLLLRGEPQAGREHWFTIGGAVEAGETPAEAAVRELLEETGIRLDVEALGAPFYVGAHRFRYAGRRFDNHARFFAVRLDAQVDVAFGGLEPGEVVEEAAWRLPSEFPLDGASDPPLRGLLDAAVAALDPGENA